ncbi:non-hydrolyzing UDP-N-acetylglucosamine 2-epimerase [Morganella morganii]|uniref:non-hydrolyzing UDP-N-acetylglucosamine 2-epimerase n=1 Tax=Morganella morganii TaxID=582 RepID=UPI0034D62E65
MTKNILIVFGTRPEAIKMIPIILELKKTNHNIKVCITAQHREMLDQILVLFNIIPDYDLNIMSSEQTLHNITSKILMGLKPIFENFLPDLVLVHGDTATTFATSLSAYYHKVEIGHIEAGLRTGNLYSPWPEEANRKLTAVLSKYHFAPTEIAKKNLLSEGYPENSIYVTGNTVIDTLLLAKEQIDKDKGLSKILESAFGFLNKNRKIILVTGHRRENFGNGFKNICEALAFLANKYPDIDIVYPVHLNPNVQKPVNEVLKGIRNIYLIPPQEYIHFIYLMTRSVIILTDSGGIQEEGPALGIPVLVMRNETERPEALKSGNICLVGTHKETIINTVTNLLESDDNYNKMASTYSPFGDGMAAKRICDIISKTN